MLTCKSIEINKRISADCSLFGLSVYLYHFKSVKLFKLLSVYSYYNLCILNGYGKIL